MHGNCKVPDCRYCARMDSIARDLSLGTIPKLRPGMVAINNKDIRNVLARAKAYRQERIKREREQSRIKKLKEQLKMKEEREVASETVAFRLPVELLEILKQRARDDGRSLSDYVRRLIKAEIERAG